MGINPRLSDLKGPRTSKLDWRYFEHNIVDRSELQVGKNLQKVTGTKMAEKLNNFDKFDRKKSNSCICLTKDSCSCPWLNPVLIITGEVS